jgi:gliding-associated putative ABC transporter substrate-binding component GldG
MEEQLQPVKPATPKQQNRKRIAIVILGLLALNFASHYFFKRFDLTKDGRYTLSQTSRDIVNEAADPIYIQVFLEGDVTADYKRLQDETRQMLQEFEAYNPNVQFSFFNPLDESESSNAEKRELIYNIHIMDHPQDRKDEKAIKGDIASVPDLNEAVLRTFTGAGMQPASVTINYKGKQSETVIFPWAIATCNGKSVKIPLLKNQRGATAQENVESSVQNLEYAFADGLNRVVREKQKKIVVLQGIGEMAGPQMGSFLKQLRDNYFIGPFTLDSVAVNPQKTLKDLSKYDLAIIAKPRKKLTEEQKQVLDQYIVNGGKTLWMVDAVQAEFDSLYNSTGTTPALPRDLGLNDMLFKYGVRILPDLVKDEMATPIKLATGAEGNNTQYQQYLWKFAPFVYPDSVNQNPIVKNLGGIKLDFASGIDTLKNGIKKNILLASSQYSKLVGTPTAISLNMVTEEFNPKEYTKPGFIPVAVLLEGSFHSMYENRLLPFKDPAFKTVGKPSKMIVIADGDIAKNQFDKDGKPVELGYDKWTGEYYENKDFLMNCVNYLLDDTGLINIRSKDVSLPMLNTKKVYDTYSTVQLITIGLPLLVLGIFGLLFTWLRRRAYSK